MTPGITRLATSGYHGATPTRHHMTGIDRTIRRLPSTPPLRPPDPPHGPSHSETWHLWEELDLWSCTYCDAPFGEMVVGEVDHIVPVTHGGPHELHNLTPACRECNRRKSDRPVRVWLTELAGQMST